MSDKKYKLAVGTRSKSGTDLIGETARRNIVEHEEKKMKRQGEVEDLEHRAKVKDLTSTPPEQTPLVQIKPIEFDIQSGEKAEKERADKAQDEATKAREQASTLQGALADERFQRLQDSFKLQVDDLRKMLDDKKDEKSIADKLAEIKETATTIGWGPEQHGTQQIPGDIQIQLQKMSNDMQLRLAEMNADQSRRDKEWQLTVKQWEDEKELKRAEMNLRATAEAERTELMRSGLGTMGKVIGQSFMEEGGVSAQVKQFSVEASVGEEGDVPCPGCEASIFLPPDANEVICPSCGSIGKVVRKDAAKGKVGK